MTIVVHTTSDARLVYEGTGWHVDEAGHLHIIGAQGTGNTATLHRDHWAGVGKA